MSVWFMMHAAKGHHSSFLKSLYAQVHDDVALSEGQEQRELERIIILEAEEL